MNTTTTTTQKQPQAQPQEKVKITRLCKILLNNAQYTTHFVNKTDHASIFEMWKTVLTQLKADSFNYYRSIAEGHTEEVIAQNEKAVYTSIKAVLALVGEIPTKDGKTSTKINSKVLFFDSVSFAVNHKARLEIKDLTKAREDLKNARLNYKKTCLTSDGLVINGLNPSILEGCTKAIEEAQARVNALLTKKNASIFATMEVSFGSFAKHFEIALRKAILHNYNFTEKQAKAEKQKTKATRKANRQSKAKTK